MKPKLDSYLRHIFTTLIAAAVVGLTAFFALDADEVRAVTEGLGKMGEGAVMVLLVVAPILGRVLWAWFSRIFRSGSGEDDSAGGLGLCIAIGCGVAGLFGGLPSCAALDGMPIRVGIETPDATVGYSSKGGLSVSARVRAEK